MNIWAWIGLTGIVIFTLIPLLQKENRTKINIWEAIVNVLTVCGIIIAVLIFNVNILFAIVGGFIVMIVLDRKTYTKKRLMIYGGIILTIIIAGNVIFRDNPDYVLNHLRDHPETTSLYVVENGEEIITYQSDIVRPLASTVKILVAVQYAMEVDAGTLDPDSYVPLDDLKQYYYKGSDGNAHEEWLDAMEGSGKINHKNEVTLHDVAKGMITFSSNANTDYFIDLMGVHSINERAESLGLTEHEEVYPLVGALLIPEDIQKDDLSQDELVEELENMPMDEYREIAKEKSEQMKDGTINMEDYTFEMPINLQKIWSKRLTGASANNYGKLLAMISNDELPDVANETIRDLLEWPLEVNEENNEYFTHFGAKGGSTGFILNNVIYVEDHDGNKIESVLLTDDLSIWQQLMISHNFSSFESKLIMNEDYRLKVQRELSD